MKKFIGNIKRKGTSPERNGSATPTLPQGDGPDAVIVREVTAFCESGAPGSGSAGEEYLHLPAIVDAAESSPSASRQAAATIRRFLSKEYNQRGWAQYNAVMLTRILTDNPAQVFTQNFDSKFVSTIKDLLRDGKDTSVQQILRETLDYFEAEKVRDNKTLEALVEMWRKEKGKNARLRPPVGYGYSSGQQRLPPRPPRGLPPPDELAARIEEAKTTARLLIQTVQSTPQSELLTNDLVKEFAERARGANKSIQNYMNCENPAPDSDTMLTLIETNDQLNVAMSKHQRALLQARKALGLATPSPQPQTGPPMNSFPMPQHQPGQNVYSTPPQQDRNSYTTSPPPRQNTYDSTTTSQTKEQFLPPSGPPPGARGAVRNLQQTEDYENAYSVSDNAPSGGNSYSNNTYDVGDNPFADDSYSEPPKKSYSLFDRSQNPTGASQAISGGISSDEPQSYGSNNAQNMDPRHPAYGYQSQNSIPRQETLTNTENSQQTAPLSNDHYRTQPPSNYRNNPVSPVDDTNAVSGGINNLRL